MTATGPAVFAGLSLVLGALFTLVLLRLREPRLTILNYRGRPVPVVGGIAIFLAAGATEAGIRAAAAVSALPEPFALLNSPDHLGTLLLVGGFFALGLVDDVAGDRSSKGMGGHLRALLGGRVTTGALKAVGGLALALAVGLWWAEWYVPVGMLNAVVIALSANLINLLDLRPGRAAKGFLLVGIPAVLAARGSPFLNPAAAVTGALLAWLPADLSERGTLGDAGANLLGAVVGAGLVLGTGTGSRIVALALLVALTLASEKVSFTRVIAQTPALRWLDDLGRPGTEA